MPRGQRLGAGQHPARFMLHQHSIGVGAAGVDA